MKKSILAAVLLFGCSAPNNTMPGVVSTDGGTDKADCVLNHQYPCTADIEAYGNNIVITVGVGKSSDGATITDCTINGTPYYDGSSLVVSISCPGAK